MRTIAPAGSFVFGSEGGVKCSINFAFLWGGRRDISVAMEPSARNFIPASLDFRRWYIKGTDSVLSLRQKGQVISFSKYIA